MDCVLWAAACFFLGGLVGLPVASAGSGDHHSIPKDLEGVLTDMEKHIIASVDGDPDFIVGVQGLHQPLCFRLEGEPGQVVRLLQDRESGVVVNARLSRPNPDVPRTYLSAVLIARRDFRVVAKVGRVLVNRYRFAWGPVSVRRVHGHRVLIAPTLLALTLRNMNVTLVVKRHLPEGRRPSANDTDSRSSPNTASVTPAVITPRHNNATDVVMASRSARRRGGRRRRPDDMEHEPRRRNRRRRRPPDRRRKKQKKGKGGKSSAAKSRSKRETRSEVLHFKDLVSPNPRLWETNAGYSGQQVYEKNVDDTESDSRRQDRNDGKWSLGEFENWRVGESTMSSRESWKHLYKTNSKLSDKGSRLPANVRSRRSTSRNSPSSSSRESKRPRDDSRRAPSRGSRRRSRGGSRRSPNRRSRRPPRDGSRNVSRVHPRRTSRRDSGRSSSNMRARSSSGASPTPQGQADDAERNASASGGGDVASGSGLARDMVAYVGFYVADARDLSTQTHGMLGQFLHKDVTLERVRQKANGVLKARLLVERPRPHHVKATQRTRTNMALNSSTTCWWLRDGGLGVVDGVYTDYLLPRFRATEFLPLPPGLIGQ